MVALKMIPAGRFAGEMERRRFGNEAEAVARLDHPHIVPVYEVGEHEGHNYFSMKRIEGTSLAANLSGYRDRPRETARLVATVARAVHHAHERGVLHRDLKPSNILLDPHGEPHLTDFGLAKRLEADAALLTGSGDILGTPAYMAPEQAGGQRGEVTTATDVHGLGALLYALLTGHAPFRGESVADTLVQVRGGSPEPVNKSNARVPRDLETVCMRCLEREPARRYASADAVADELERWIKGEPIAARPVGKLERGFMWCRRNPAVAGLTTSVATALILGTSISTVLAFRANDQAAAERRQRVEAENAENEAKKARDQTQGTYARTLIQPLDAAGDANDSLGRLEVQTLWRLAEDPGGNVALRFLKEATRIPKTARQLCARSEPALIAAVGLDPLKRKQALAVFLKRLDETDLHPAQRGDIALTALELIDRAGPDMGACEKAAVEAMKACSHEPWLRVCANHLVKSAERLEPATAGRLIVEMLALQRSSSERAALAVALCEVAGRLEPDAASRIILKVLAMKLGFYESERLAEALAKVTVRQHPTVARQSCREALQLLTEALTRTRSYVQWTDGVGLLWDADDRSRLGSGFAALATRLPRGEAIRFLTESLNGAADAEVRQRVATALAALIARTPADLAVEIPADAIFSLATALIREREWQWDALFALDSGLKRLANDWRPAKPSDARRVVEFLATALKAEKNPGRRVRLAFVLAPMAERLGPEESARVCLAATDSLLSDDFPEEDAEEWCRGLVAMTIRLPAKTAAETIRRIASAPRRNASSFLGDFDAVDGARIARVFVAALGQETDQRARTCLGEGLCKIAEKMDPDEAARICAPVFEVMCEAAAPWGTFAFPTNGFAIIASRQAPAVAGRSATILAETLKSGARGSEAAGIAGALAIVASRMEPTEAHRICGAAARAIAVTVERNRDCIDEATSLAALAGRMEPVEARGICGDVARALVALLREGDLKPDSGFSHAAALGALATRMEPVGAQACCGEAVRILVNRWIWDESRFRRTNARPYFLLALMAQMAPSEAGRMLAEFQWETLSGACAPVFVTGLSSATARTDPATAERVCESAIRNLVCTRSVRSREFDPRRNEDLNRQETSGRGEFVAGDLEDRRGFDSAVAELLPRLDLQRANAEAAGLAALMCCDVDAAYGDSEVLARILTVTSPAQRAVRYVRMAMEAVVNGIGALPAAVSFAAEPSPSRLTNQQLVDLLKMPTCLGKARRVVLDQLGKIHGRRFADHWEFVRYAQENHLSLDLTTSPRRPNLAALGAGELPSR
jgi:hypothetical protein